MAHSINRKGLSRMASEMILQLGEQSLKMLKLNRRVELFSLRTAKNFLRRKPIKRDPHFWDNGLLLLALRQIDERVARFPSEFSKEIQEIGITRPLPKLVDHFVFYYAIYDDLSQEEKATLFDFLVRHPKDDKGGLYYRASLPVAFLDTTGMVTPFLAKYYRESKDPLALKIALDQFSGFMNFGLDARSSLPYHGYGMQNDTVEKRGIEGWGRGVGWIVFGMAEVLSILNSDTPEFSIVEGYLERLLQICSNWQRADGSFSWHLTSFEAHADTSTTGMLGYAMAKGASTSSLLQRFDQNARMASTYLFSQIETGRVVNSSAECMGIGMYPQRFESNAWGQAFGVLLLLEVPFNE